MEYQNGEYSYNSHPWSEVYTDIKYHNSRLLSICKNACDVIRKNQNVHSLHTVIVTKTTYE